ncbi:MAG: magnesium-translocating P-type ATPase [Nitrospirae bacterium RBG_13_41_22]|nr:MAG: magnesium-translocating P-type ATPase [Nitrospirae bacterium RBG_13_41_22]OHE56939.1 MAG: magnesium-translocating P-type ATPase [Thermodesulfovibrio sp. RBG_19FT_COMBO_42_12]
MDIQPVFWSIPSAELLRQLQTTPQGLTKNEARQRFNRYGANLLRPKKRSNTLTLLLSQFKSPLILILIFAAGLSFFLHDPVNAGIILTIVLISGLLGFWQERGAANAIDKLLSIVQIKVEVLRDGAMEEIPVEEIVSGDIVILNAGDVIPGDCLIIESKDLFADEAALTGETYPEDKVPGILPEETPLAQRTNTLFMGTHVVSGSAKALVVHTGKETEFGKVSERLAHRPSETEFERGVRRFGYFLMEVTLLLVMIIFAVNVYLARPVLDSFLFSLALAVGLTPQLLPAIISVNLAHGAKYMALKKVIVKRLASIENFGSMNVLCSDKTGTLTEGVVHLKSALDIDGNESEKVLLFGYLNSFYEKGFTNPIDEAICSYRTFDLSDYQKIDEEPYDFVRKRLSILVSKGNAHLMITKGALQNVLAVCSKAENSSGAIVDIEGVREEIQRRFEELSSQGLRTIGVACRDMGSASQITKDHEADMTFLGFLVLFDPVKSGIVETITELRSLGISLKIITGDNRLVASHLSQQIGLSNTRILTGPDLRRMSDEALLRQVNEADVFAEVEPNQKERIILALKKAKNVVGYLGDGINDASALHASDVGISVESAVDVAKDAADIVLLEKNLAVLVQGVQEGRRTFANTLKYVFMATSANFGNMFSMAGASLFLPFLPLLPKQILLTNLLTDFPEMTIATDDVDRELVEKPRKWDIKFIKRFMIFFGIISSVFDYITFGVLLLMLKADPILFRTGWFVESVLSASLVVLVIRTRKPIFKSKPGRYLLITTLLIAFVVIVFPYLPFSTLLGFQPLPAKFNLTLILILLAYIVTAEVGKKIFYQRFANEK